MQIPASTRFPILYLSFNQDGTCISVGTQKGFRIFNATPFKPLYSHDFQDGCSVVSMLYRSSILAITGAGNSIRYPRSSITLYDDQSGRNLGEVDLHHPILNTIMTREKVFTALDTQILVHNIADLRQVDKIETMQNPHGLVCVHGEQDISLLTLGSKQGEVILRQYQNNQLLQVQTLQCHDSAIRCIAFSPDGQYFATASQKGTLIRVFSIKDKKIIKELRRGSKECTIYSIAISEDNSMLACTSSHKTLHIFSAVEQVGQKGIENKRSGLSFLKKINKYFDSEWSFAKYNLSCSISMCRFVSNDSIVVACADGTVYKLGLGDGRLDLLEEGDMLQDQ